MNISKLKAAFLVAGLLVVAAATAVALSTTSAQTVHTQVVDGSGNVREDAYIRLPLPASEQAYADIDGHQMKGLIEEVTAISLKSRDDGNQYWGRIAGTKYETMTQEWVKAKFEALEMEDIHLQEFDLPPQWFPISWDVSFTSGGRTVRAASLLPALRSVPTPAQGLELEAVWVGTGSSADFLGRNVHGKAVFIHTIPAPGSMGHSASGRWEGAIRRAAQLGAGAIFVVYGISDNFAIWQGLGRSPDRPPGGAHTTNEIGVPGFFLGYQDGNVVREMIGRGEPVTVSVNLEVERREGLKSGSIWGTLPGRTNENIMVMAHLDGYFEGALDNASGLSVMIAVAEHFARIPKDQRRRNLIFIGTAGHHVGSPGARWLHENRETALAKTALAINCEHVSVKQTVYWGPRMRKTNVHSPRRWWVHGSDRLKDIVLRAYATFGVSVWDDMESGAAGEMGRMARDVPSIQIIRSPEIKHTDADTPEWVPEAGLEAVARAYAKIIDEANNLNLKDLGPAQ